MKHLIRRFLLAALLASGLPLARADVVATFDQASAIAPFAPEKTGALYALIDAPAGSSAAKAGQLGWGATHRNFLEYYYARNLTLPTGPAPQGRLVLHVRTETPTALWTLAVRVKTPAGEMFHFDTRLSLAAGQWQDVAIAIKPGASKSHWGGANTGLLEGPLALAGFALLVNPSAPPGGLQIDRISWESSAPAASVSEKPAQPASPIGTAGAATATPADSRYSLADAHLFSPPWNSPVIYGESVILEQTADSAPADGTLLFAPSEVLRVRSSDWKTEYRQGRDYTVDAAHHRLVLTPGSRIPFIKEADLYKKKGEKRAISHKLGDPDTYLLYAERWFPTKQVEVDYKPAERWNGYVPAFAGDALPRTLARLRQGKGLRIAVTGDSIAAGANASNRIPPHQPPFTVLFQRGLEQVYGGAITLANFSKGGGITNGGLAGIGSVIAAKPDLVLIAYGMNDTAGKDPAGYQSRIKAMIDAVRAASPGTEFILISSCLGNPEWSWSPAAQFPAYEKALRDLAGPGIAFADATALWTDLLKQKRYLDLTGNGINHPNDFGHRLYAQLLLALLVSNP